MSTLQSRVIVISNEDIAMRTLFVLYHFCSQYFLTAASHKQRKRLIFALFISLAYID